MGDINAALSHLVLAGVAGRGVSRMSGHNWTQPGMHANFFIHGVLGFFNNKSDILGDLADLYEVSLKASKYLALPCLMADLYRYRRELSLLHLASGVVPFAMAVSGNDNEELGNTMIALNLVSLLIYSFQRNRTYGYYTTAAGAFAYFMAPNIDPKTAYPLGLAVMEYCAYRLYFLILDI